MKTHKTLQKNSKRAVLSTIAKLALTSAKIGAGTASSWGDYQPVLPKELTRK